VTPSPSPSPTPTPTVVPSPTPTTGGNSQEQSQTQNNTQTVNITVQGQTLGAKSPKVQPETGASAIAFATMFGAAPMGLMLRRFTGSKKRKDSLSELASRLVSDRTQG